MNSKIFIISAFIICLNISCNKRKKCTSGTDGNITLIASPKHHIVPIFNQSAYLDTIYLKFNTSEAPNVGTLNYDAFFVGNVGESTVRCEGLKCGDYYILATGFDTTINERVYGGIPFTLNENEGTINIDVPVVE